MMRRGANEGGRSDAAKGRHSISALRGTEWVATRIEIA
jgi:hypothetical protein